MRHLITLFCSFCLCMFLPTLTQAAPKTRRVDCGLLLPASSSRLGKRRYAAPGYYKPSNFNKFFRRIYGKNGRRYKRYPLFSLPNVIAYHFVSKRRNTRWKSFNLAYYPRRRRARMQIYVFCR